jgi:hypothetical protein
MPVFILLLDQLDFPRARPSLHSLLLRDRLANVVVDLVLYQSMDAVLPSKSRNGIGSVFKDATY